MQDYDLVLYLSLQIQKMKQKTNNLRNPPSWRDLQMKIAGMTGWEVIMLHVNEKLSEMGKIPNFSIELTYIGAINILRNTLRGEIQILWYITGSRGYPNMLQLSV